MQKEPHWGRGVQVMVGPGAAREKQGPLSCPGSALGAPEAQPSRPSCQGRHGLHSPGASTMPSSPVDINLVEVVAEELTPHGYQLHHGASLNVAIRGTHFLISVGTGSDHLLK